MIRSATVQDSIQINRLSQYLGYAEVTDELARSRLELTLNSGRDRVWVFENDARILGWIHAFVAA